MKSRTIPFQLLLDPYCVWDYLLRNLTLSVSHNWTSILKYLVGSCWFCHCYQWWLVVWICSYFGIELWPGRNYCKLFKHAPDFICSCFLVGQIGCLGRNPLGKCPLAIYSPKVCYFLLFDFKFLLVLYFCTFLTISIHLFMPWAFGFLIYYLFLIVFGEMGGGRLLNEASYSASLGNYVALLTWLKIFMQKVGDTAYCLKCAFPTESVC